MTVSTNRLIELSITSDPSATDAGTTLSFTGGGLVSTVDASLDADVVGTAGVMQAGDTVDLDGDGVFESTYQGRFNYTVGSTYTLGDGSTVVSSINIIEITTGGVSSYYLIIPDSIASSLDTNDLSSITLGTTFATSPNTAGLNFDDADTYQLVCFTKGTLIKTNHADCPVERLKIGDHILTKDNGFQKIRWIGSRKVLGVGKFAPVVFQPETIGNSSTLRLSQQHRVCLSNPMVEFYFGCGEILAPAHSLVNGTSITLEEGGQVEYFHILFDHHEIILSDGAWTESFLPSPQTVNQQGQETQDEIYSLFPDLVTNPNAYGKSARTCLNPWEVKVLSNINAVAPR